MSLQDNYLNELRKEKYALTIYLTNGFQLKGKLVSFDNFVIVIDAGEKQNMIYKHAISTIEPSNGLKITDLSGAAPAVPEKKPGRKKAS